uniref:NAD(P)H dehydrogenase (quinone) n=1 Tax=Triticum urartu TaxID=4572 RepID=A0A8R7U2C5_TRIUA
MGSVTASTTAKPILRVVAISGSLRSNSWHVGLIRAAEELCEESIPGLRIDYIDISGLPMANPDLETDGGDGFPPAVEAFRNRISAADCFLFASPECNYSVTGSLKNALDWASRGTHKCWADKAAAIVCAGGDVDFGGGRASLHQSTCARSGYIWTCTSSISRSSTSGRTRTRPSWTARGTSSTPKPESGSRRCSSRCRPSRSGCNAGRID